MKAVLATLALALGACGFDPGGGTAAGAGGDGGAGAIDGGGGRFDAGGAIDATSLDAAPEATANVSCAATVVPPAIDGNPLGPWLGVALIPFAVTDAQLVADEHPSYQDDAVVEFGCLHDANNVYFFFDVTDGAVQDDSPSQREDDSIVIFLDGAGDLSGPYGDDDHALALGSDSEGMDYAAGSSHDLDGSVFSEVVDGGYRVEVEIDKPSITDTLGSELGFNLAIIDDDGWSDNLRDIFALRHVPDDQVAHACPNCCEGQAAPWCDTRVFGTLTLE